MLLVRDVFHCRPGKSRELADKLKAVVPSFERDDGFRNSRVMIDLVADYWTVVLQAEVDDLAQFDRHMQNYGSRPEVREAMAGYLELVDGGHREIYRIV